MSDNKPESRILPEDLYEDVPDDYIVGNYMDAWAAIDRAVAALRADGEIDRQAVIYQIMTVGEMLNGLYGIARAKRG